MPPKKKTYRRRIRLRLAKKNYCGCVKCDCWEVRPNPEDEDSYDTVSPELGKAFIGHIPEDNQEFEIRGMVIVRELKRPTCEKGK